MASPRQQRAKRNSRLVTPTFPAQPPLLALRLLSHGTHTINAQTIQVAQPPGAGLPDIDMQIVGVPQMRRTLDGAFPVSCTPLVGFGQLQLTYGGAAINSGEEFTMGPYDTALRTNTGGFAAPSVLTLP